tara:strand:+ start:28600 stop:28890 length:291 start_codon:yes stop_codon:yes gene_type:complete
MIGIIAHLTIQDGKQDEFESVVKDLIGKVRANEPGCLMYELYKKQGSETDYYFMEKYEGPDGLAAHGASDHFKAAQPALGACLAGRPTITRMDGVI